MEVNQPTTAISRDELKRMELEEINRLQADFASLVPDDVLPFLALAPYIPVELPSQLPFSLDECVRRNIVQTGPGPRVWSGQVFWMEPSAAESALRELRSRKPRGFAPLVMKSLSMWGGGQLSMGGKKLESDPTLWRWTRLAQASSSPSAFYSLLKEEVEGAVRKSQELLALWSPEARAWIEAASPIGAALEGGFQAAVAAAKRRFELFHRRARDRASLRNYFPRDELDQAFRDLLKDEDHWALHFIGSGGSGKTMQICHLALDVAEREHTAVARVDFDYLNPRYPVRDPLLLLKALAEDFRLDESGDTSRSFGEFDAAAEDVYRRLEGLARSGEVVNPSLQDEDVQRAIRAFAEALVYLSSQAQPILILDTCEELAKVQSGVGVPPNVRHTLDLLKSIYDTYRELHSGGPGLRVIFSGRRQLPELPHLRVQQVHGFSPGDAQKFLERYQTGDQRPLDSRIIGAILRITAPDGYSPYDLDTYAAWAAVDKTLTEEKLTSEGPTLYVRERIVDRLLPVVRRIFPALAILGRFDREMLLQLIGPGANQAADVGEVLQQEWVLADSAGTVDTWRLDALFRQRVLKFYRIEGTARQDACRRLAQILPPLTRSRKFQDLTPQCFAACLEVLSTEPAKAAAWWDEMEARIAAEAEWEWAADLLKYLEPEPDDKGPMTAAIFATKAAVMLHTGSDPAPAWKVVEQRAAAHPVAEGAQRLLWRAACALETPPKLTAQPVRLRDQDAASYLACMERELESGRKEATMGAAAWVTGPLASAQARDLQTFRFLLAGRSALLLGSRRECADFFERALGLCRQGSFEPRQVWLDWIRPGNPKHRILLEYSLIFPGGFTGAYADVANSVFEGPLASIDSDRLAAAWLTATLETSSWRTTELAPKFQALYASSVALLAEAPACGAHRKYPPFAIALLAARGLAGEAEWALNEIKDLASKYPPADVKQRLDELLLRIVVRMRLTSEGEQIPTSVGGATPLAVIARALQVPGIAVPADLRSDDPMESAELEFLRGSDAGSEDAYSLAEIRGDDLECLESRMLQALACARRGDREGAVAKALAVQPMFEKLTAGSAGVPPWSDILKAAETDLVDGTLVINPASSLLDGMGTPRVVWRPWVVRILACLTPPPRLNLAAWILEHDVTVVDGNRKPATELAFVLASMPEPSPAPSQARSARSFFVWALAVGALSAGLVGLYIGYAALLSALGIELGTVGRIASFLVVAPLVFVLIAQAPRLFTFLLDLYARVFQVTAAIEVQRPSQDLNRPLLSPAVWRQSVRIGFVSVDQAARPIPASSSERYSDMLRELVPSYREDALVFRLFRLLPGLFLRVELTVDSATAAAPWEAIFAPHRFIVIRRVTRERRLTQGAPWTAPMEVLTLGGNSYLIRRQDWGSNFVPKTGSAPTGAAAPSPKLGVLRLIGAPVDSTAGLVLQVREGGRQAYTVRGADLFAQYPGLRMCIVQCPPAEVRRRLSGDRRTAAVLKRIGAEIFTSGVPIVVVVPVLPDRASDDLIDKLYTVLGRLPGNAVPQVEAVLAEFRRQPLDKISADIEAAQEILQDVCLYAIAKTSFKMNSSEEHHDVHSGLV